MTDISKEEGKKGSSYRYLKKILRVILMVGIL